MILTEVIFGTFANPLLSTSGHRDQVGGAYTNVVLSGGVGKTRR